MPDAATIQKTLGHPLTLPNGQQVKNRLLKSAMSETLGSGDNRVTAELVRLYQWWADGGVGLSITGNVMVDSGALGEPGNVCVEDERDLELLKEWSQAAKSSGGLIYMQINHPGRQVPRFLNKQSVAPSAVPFRAELASAFATPRALSHDEVLAVVARFAETARIAELAGFDGVQIHGAHGYLVSQFLSPHTNQRTDAWGGTPEARRAFAVAIIHAIRGATSPGFGVGIKINSADFQRGGITEEQSMDTIVALAAEGLDFVEVSGGTYEAPVFMAAKQSTREREAYFLAFAETLRERLDVPLVVTGGFRSGAAMADAIEGGAVDLVGLARPLVIQPSFPNDVIAKGDIRVDVKDLTTGIGFVDRIAMLELAWYERQMHRMGRGKPPLASESALKALFFYVYEAGPKSLRRRR